MVQLTLDLKLMPRLAKIRLINKGAFFNPEILVKNSEILSAGIFSTGYKVEKVTEDTSKFVAEIRIKGENLIRKLELTFPNY